MTGISRTGGTHRSDAAGARSTSPSGEGQGQAQRIAMDHPAPSLAAPDGLRRRTDSGHVPGGSRPDAARAEASPAQAQPRVALPQRVLPADSWGSIFSGLGELQGVRLEAASPGWAEAEVSSRPPLGAPNAQLASTQPGTSTDLGGQLSSASVASGQARPDSRAQQQALAGQPAPVAQAPRHSQEALARFAAELHALVPLILEIKTGAATRNAISQRAGVMKGFANVFNANGTLNPITNKGACRIHNKLKAIRQSHPEVVQAFETAQAGPALRTQQSTQAQRNRFASELQALVPLILEVKNGEATPRSISDREGVMSGFRLAFNLDGTLKPAGANANTQAIHNKLEAIGQSHPEVVEAFEAALARPALPIRRPAAQLDRFASQLRALVPLILEVKSGAATPGAITNRPGGTPTFSNVFNPDGTLKPATSHDNAHSIHSKLDAIRQSHPEVVQAFEAAQALPAPPRSGVFRVPANRPPTVPAQSSATPARLTPSSEATGALTSPAGLPRVRVHDMGRQLPAVAQAIIALQQRRQSLEAVEQQFPGLSRLIDRAGRLRDDIALGEVYRALTPAEQRDFPRLIQDLMSWVGHLSTTGPGESSAHAASAIPGPAAMPSWRQPAQAASGSAPAVAPAYRYPTRFGISEPATPATPVQPVELSAGLSVSGLSSQWWESRPPDDAAWDAEVSSHVPQPEAPRGTPPRAAPGPGSPSQSELSGFSQLSNLPEARVVWDLNTPASSPERNDEGTSGRVSGLSSQWSEAGPSGDAARDAEASSHAPQPEAPPGTPPRAGSGPGSPSPSELSGFSQLSNLPDARVVWDLNTPASSP